MISIINLLEAGQYCGRSEVADKGGGLWQMRDTERCRCGMSVFPRGGLTLDSFQSAATLHQSSLDESDLTSLFALIVQMLIKPPPFLSIIMLLFHLSLKDGDGWVIF